MIIFVNAASNVAITQEPNLTKSDYQQYNLNQHELIKDDNNFIKNNSGNNSFPQDKLIEITKAKKLDTQNSDNISEWSEPQPPQSIKKINISDYKQNINYAGLTDKEIVVYNKIINIYEEAVEGEIYPERIPFDYISTDEYYKIASFAAMRFGNYRAVKDFIDVEVVNNANTYLSLNAEFYKELKSQRNINNTHIDEVLSEMNEGNELQKLKQISDWFAMYIKYNANNSNVSDLFQFSAGNCNAISLAFKMFAERIGINCDFIAGYANNGKYHAWNRVYLSDGSIKYYDVTFYMSTGNTKYISTDSLPFKVLYENTYY